MARNIDRCLIIATFVMVTSILEVFLFLFVFFLFFFATTSLNVKWRCPAREKGTHLVQFHQLMLRVFGMAGITIAMVHAAASLPLHPLTLI